MKTSQTEQLLFFFSRTPNSISKRVRSLAGKVAGELLRLLAELSVCRNKGSVECSYRQLGELLGKSVETIARAAKLLLRSGDVVAEGRPGRSYRWSVLLEARDIRVDPARVCLVKAEPKDDAAETPRAAVDLSRETAPERPAARAPVELALKSAGTRPAVEQTPEVAPVSKAPVAVEMPSNPAEGRDSKLFKRLTNLGVSARVAKDLLRTCEQDNIVAALERVKGRSDVKNRAAYVVAELRDGGYEESCEMVQFAGAHEKKSSGPSEASAGYISAEMTRAERLVMEAERTAKQESFHRDLRVLEQRCSGLADGLKTQLKESCRQRVFQLVPQTSSRESLLNAPVYKKLAFKDVMERFFELLDQGIAPEQAVFMA